MFYFCYLHSITLLHLPVEMGKEDVSEKIATSNKESGTPEYGSDSTPPIHHAEKLSIWTRMGCTPESFQRRTKGGVGEQLDATLKPRHLHMIAIGGSIGAGFFVGSGSALSRGVSATLFSMDASSSYRVPRHFLSISPLWEL